MTGHISADILASHVDALHHGRSSQYLVALSWRAPASTAPTVSALTCAFLAASSTVYYIIGPWI